MPKTPKKTKTKEVGEIVRKYRERLGNGSGRAISRAQFGELLIEGFSTLELSRQTIYNWERGFNDPDFDFLLGLYTYHVGTNAWQKSFAAECLEEMMPETFASGIIKLQFVREE